MRADAAPVERDEFVLRRIAGAHLLNGETVKPEAFRPSKQDTDGLSVYRAQFATIDDVLSGVADEVRRKTYGIARLSVADLQDLGLSVRPDPTNIPGHALIVELNTTAYESDKLRWKAIQARLAELATRDLLHSPST